MKIVKKKSKKKISKNIKLFILSIGLIMIWRGVWNFLDYYLFPNNFDMINYILLVSL